MATFTTYNQIGQAEDVSDIITNLTPSDTPFYSSIKSEKISARIYEWQIDTLASGAANAAAEGADATDVDHTPTTMLSNTTQIFTKAFKISRTADVVKTYGRAKETAYALGKKLKEIKSDVEFAMVGAGVQAMVTGDGSTARKFANVWQQIDSTMKFAAAGTGTAALSEAKVLEAGQELYKQGGDATILMVKPEDSLKIADFAKAAGRYREIENGTADKQLINVVNLYVSPFGEYKVVINRHINSSYALMYDPSMWRTAVLDPFTRETLAKTGDAERHFIVGEIGLKHMNPKASAAITALS